LAGSPLGSFLTSLMMPNICSLRRSFCITLLLPLRCYATRPSAGCGLLRFRVGLPIRTGHRFVRLLRRPPCRCWIASSSRSPCARSRTWTSASSSCSTGGASESLRCVAGAQRSMNRGGGAGGPWKERGALRSPQSTHVQAREAEEVGGEGRPTCSRLYERSLARPRLALEPLRWRGRRRSKQQSRVRQKTTPQPRTASSCSQRQTPWTPRRWRRHSSPPSGAADGDHTSGASNGSSAA
jgi:hypothetical protein